MPARSSKPMKLILLATMLFVLSPASAAWAEKAPETPEDDQAPKTVGVELGTFLIKDYRPIQGQKVRISFTLYAETPADNAKAFKKQLMRCEMRVRDQVITSMRIADTVEFEDPELRLIRRRLDLRLGRALPELKIDAVYFNNFRYLVD